MTQTIAPYAAPPATVPATAPAPVHRSGLRGALSRTPGRLRVAGVVAVSPPPRWACVGLNAGLAQSQALSDADADTTQLVGIQDVRNDLVVADATATNAFLVGGLEPPEQRARYDEADRVRRERARAAGRVQRGRRRAAGPGDRGADHLHRAGRAGPRQQPAGLPGRRRVPRPGVRGPAQRRAARSSTSWCRPTATACDASFDSVGSVPWLLALGILALAALVVVQVWLAKRTHRRLNAGLFWATVLALAAIDRGRVRARARRRSGPADVRNGPYDETVSRLQAYSLANDAKSQESFTLIKRGSGAAYEEQFVARDRPRPRRCWPGRPSTRRSSPLFDDWLAAHAEIRALDDGGDWDEAVALAISDEPGAPNDVFATFSTAACEQPRAPAPQQTHEAPVRGGRRGGARRLADADRRPAGGGPVLARHLEASGGVPVTTTRRPAALGAALAAVALLAGCAGCDPPPHRAARSSSAGGLGRRSPPRRCATTPTSRRRPTRRARRGASVARHPRPRRPARRRLGRHPADGLAQPALRADRGLRHRHAERRVRRDLRRRRDRLQFRVITSAQRLEVLENHEVDLVARTFTMNCERWETIAFSAEYLTAGQKVLVTRDSDGDEHRGPRSPRRPARLRAGGHHDPGAAAGDVPRRRGGQRPDAHGLPGALPAGQGRRPSRATTRSWPGSSRRTRTRRSSASRSAPSRTASASPPTRSTSCGSSTACSTRRRRTAPGRPPTTAWLGALGPAPVPPVSVYGRVDSP